MNEGTQNMPLASGQQRRAIPLPTAISLGASRLKRTVSMPEPPLLAAGHPFDDSPYRLLLQVTHH